MEAKVAENINNLGPIFIYLDIISSSLLEDSHFNRERGTLETFDIDSILIVCNQLRAPRGQLFLLLFVFILKILFFVLDKVIEILALQLFFNTTMDALAEVNLLLWFGILACSLL